jgi:hypothetical protein
VFVYRSETREEQLPLKAVVKIAHCCQEVVNLKQIVHNLKSVYKNEVHFSCKSQLNYCICIWHVLAECHYCALYERTIPGTQNSQIFLSIYIQVISGIILISVSEYLVKGAALCINLNISCNMLLQMSVERKLWKSLNVMWTRFCLSSVHSVPCCAHSSLSVS